MNCPNCGAAMELFERRRYHFCNHCGTFHFIARDSGEGIHVVEGGEAADPCPLCAAPLAKSMTDEGHLVGHCEHCRGVLMDRRTFAEVLTRRRASAGGPGAVPVPIDPRDLRRQVTCPRCQLTMDVHPYYGPGNIVIDSCRGCDAVWLDSGELTQIVDAPGRDRGAQVSGPAHNLNVDWYRFWLQDYEDPDPEKKVQYERWRELRKLRDQKTP